MLALLIGVLLVVFDQLVKYWVVTCLKPIGSIKVIENLFYLTYVENRGAAFGFMDGAKWFLIVLTLVVVIGAIIYYIKIKNQKNKTWLKIAIVMICSGGVGNLIDRIFRSFVVDLFDVIIFGYDFPVFNVADILIVLGTALLMGGIIIFEDKNGNN